MLILAIQRSRCPVPASCIKDEHVHVYNISKLNRQWRGVLHRVDPDYQVTTTPSPNHIKHVRQKDKIDTCTIHMQVWGKYKNYKSKIKCLDIIMHLYEYEIVIIKRSLTTCEIKSTKQL